MRQSWRDLLFLHFSTDPQKIQQLLPKQLTVDTHDEKAWVGLVPFRMQGIRPVWAPALPWISAFPETNVRTYVHHEGMGPGVWFFSLDASRWLACRYARASFRLPYFHAAMSVERKGNLVRYSSSRKDKPGPANLTGKCTVTDPLRTAVPGSFEFFLVERYLLYTENRGRLFQGRVHHPPYPIQDVSEYSIEESLVRQAGLEPQPWESALFSPGVDVDVFGLEEVVR